MQVTEEFYRAVLNAIPVPIFLVDQDIHIHELNGAATQAFGLEREMVLKQRGGNVLHCLNSLASPEGCGHSPGCSECVIRNSVVACLAGQSTYRRRMKFTISNGTAHRELELLITAAPLLSNPAAVELRQRALLILEDITEISLLKDIIPICMHCKKVRDDQQFWQQVEGYFHHFIGVEFSHGICPDCVKQFYSETQR